MTRAFVLQTSTAPVLDQYHVLPHCEKSCTETFAASMLRAEAEREVCLGGMGGQA